MPMTTTTIRFLFAFLGLMLAACRSQRWSSQDYSGPPTFLHQGQAQAHPSAPQIVHAAIAAGNQLQGVPYQYGGGHGRPSHGVDCSGMVSHVLRSIGQLRGAGTSSTFQSYGEPGPGQWMTIYAKSGHVFMTIGGLRLDTGRNGSPAGSGPRWNPEPREVSGFEARHPAGL